jgi:hypothetical protein
LIFFQVRASSPSLLPAVALVELRDLDAGATFSTSASPRDLADDLVGLFANIRGAPPCGANLRVSLPTTAARR